ncbi:uncharacterized protein LOC116159562 [Photinus pyralis]|nr:uncharacterized protein LOC116159562 [Photinus pyralis]
MKCFKCKCELSSNTLLLSHLKHVHYLKHQDIHKCIDCNRTYSNLNAFKKHLNKNHVLISNSTLREATPLDSAISLDVPLNQSINLLDNVNHESVHSPHDFVTPLYPKNNIDINAECLKLVSSLYCHSYVNRNSVQIFVESIKRFIDDFYVPVLIEKINSYVTSNVDQDKNFIIDGLIHMISYFKNPFDGLGTEYKRFKTFENTRFFIKPVNYIIGQRSHFKVLDGVGCLIPEPVHAKFIPLRQIFSALFQLPNFLLDVRAYIQTLDKDSFVLTSFVQSNIWQQKLLQHNNKTVLPLFIYFDDYEAGNPLGSHSGKNKLGAVYVSIPCIPPQFQARLKNIFFNITLLQQ